MNNWIASDFHLGHKNIRKYEPTRPENFEELIFENLKEIPEEDTLYFLGDFCLGNDKYWHERLREFKFKKFLIRGNHDRKTATWYRNSGWDDVLFKLGIDVLGHRCVLIHNPEHCTEGVKYIIHGHLHSKTHLIKNKNKQILYSLELFNYKPIILEDLVFNYNF